LVTSNFNHWLGLEVGFFADASAQAASKNNCFNIIY
jgi:hypothetical protein